MKARDDLARNPLSREQEETEKTEAGEARTILGGLDVTRNLRSSAFICG